MMIFHFTLWVPIIPFFLLTLVSFLLSLSDSHDTLVCVPHFCSVMATGISVFGQPRTQRGRSTTIVTLIIFTYLLKKAFSFKLPNFRNASVAALGECKKGIETSFTMPPRQAVIALLGGTGC